jgi:hypothetical protein
MEDLGIDRRLILKLILTDMWKEGVDYIILVQYSDQW